jgi:Flp pilus assembly protein TadG
MMSRLSTRFRDERGQTMTEFAIVVPLLLMVVFAIIQFGILFNNWLALTDATRTGARKGAVSRRLPDPRGTTEAQVRAAAANLDQATLRVNVDSTWQPGSDVRVTATYPYTLDLFGFDLHNGELSSTTTERVE